MKKKNAIKTCGSLKGQEYAHLGHFRQSKHIEAGHNTNEMPKDNVLTRTVRGDKPETVQTAPRKAPPPTGGVRG